MILRVELESFMGCNETVELGRRTVLKGHNGSHKTTILHAIAFALCGTDAWGNQAPVFMISNEMDKMKVIVHTEKSIIQRSLTRKKSSNLKIKINDVWTPINQTNMVQFIGATEHVLAVLNPKYFFTLSDVKKKTLISNIFPKEDRMKLLEDILGSPVREIDSFDVQKKEPLRAATVFAEKRRKLSHDVATRDGKASIHTASIEEFNFKLNNTVFRDIREEAHFDLLLKRKAEYEANLKVYIAKNDFAKTVASEWGVKKKDLEDKIKTLSEDLKIALGVAHAARDKANSERMAAVGREGTIQGFRDKLDTLLSTTPREPANQSLPSLDHCPTCSQPVSKRHRDRISEENKKVKEEYNKKLDEHSTKICEAKVKLDKVLEILSVEKDKQSEAELYMGNCNMHYTSIGSNLDEAKRELARESKKVNTAPPVAPEKNFSQEKIDELGRSLENAVPTNIRVSFIEDLNRHTLALDMLNRDYAGIDENIEYYFKLEEALKRIPEKEMALLEKVMCFGNYKLDTEVSGMLTTQSGIPYTMMSSGQKMCAEVNLSLQINNHLPRKISTLFIDDAELVDLEGIQELNRIIDIAQLQCIQTKVTEGKLRAEVKV